MEQKGRSAQRKGARAHSAGHGRQQGRGLRPEARTHTFLVSTGKSEAVLSCSASEGHWT